MAELRLGSPDQTAYLRDLVEVGHLVETGVPGVYGRGAAFEDVRVALDRRVTREASAEGALRWHFPPVLSRRDLDASGYLQSFPHLAGMVETFSGAPSDLVLTPAACYPVYPAVARQGPLAPGGVTVDPGDAYVYRHEPSTDPARLQMFHMRELVRAAEPEVVERWRDAWLLRGISLLAGLGLDAGSDVAADPFFGRAGRMLAAAQREQALKFEIHVPIAGDEPTAVASFNYHQDHFTSRFGITMADGGTAHTACLGFGLERITLALLRRHGLDVHDWPAQLRGELGL